ncbi:CWC16 protein [Amylostereum chailletii]|nr:CWC16 protein [Amylostereum chailletii]
MQGFNKYYPPDYDGEKHKSLNSYRGKHALGDRARKIDQGILITRFELPFNIWCGSCEAHIGMGVRYNAEKKKIGMYYSTPIFSFRCKCHLCSGWFEIQTDPQNTRYVVVSGARKKEEDWDPEENGGFAVHDTSAAPPTDPLAALEKSTAAQTHATTVQAPRITQLQDASEHYNADPFAHSQRVRKRFRAEKKVEKAREAEDAELRSRYGLPTELALIRDDEAAVAEARDMWKQGQEERVVKRRKTGDGAPIGSSARPRSISLGSTASLKAKAVPSSSGGGGAAALKARVLANTALRTDPFSIPSSMRRKPPDKRTGVVVHKT